MRKTSATLPKPAGPARSDADLWNEQHPIGTPVRYWPGIREGAGRESATRTAAWVMPSGASVVAVYGYAGGIALTHVVPEAP